MHVMLLEGFLFSGQNHVFQVLTLPRMDGFKNKSAKCPTLIRQSVAWNNQIYFKSVVM